MSMSNQQPLDLLIVEDDPDVREMLHRAFSRCQDAKFNLECRDSPEACLDLAKLGSRKFDLAVVDMGFEALSTDSDSPHSHADIYQGERVLLARACLKPNGIVVVYSAYPVIELIVRVMRYGAADFVSKAECLPHELPERVCRLLAEIQRRQLDYDQMMNWLKQNPGWFNNQSELAGRQVALIVDKGTVQCVANGESTLELLLNYEKARAKYGPDTWPREPFVHQLRNRSPE